MTNPHSVCVGYTIYRYLMKGRGVPEDLVAHPSVFVKAIGRTVTIANTDCGVQGVASKL